MIYMHSQIRLLCFILRNSGESLPRDKINEQPSGRSNGSFAVNESHEGL